MHLPAKDTVQFTNCLLFRPGLTNLLGVRICVTTQMPSHYKRQPLVLEAQLCDLTPGQRMKHLPDHRFVVDPTLDTNSQVVELLLQNEQTYINSHGNWGRSEFITPRDPFDDFARIELRFEAGDWVAALHDRAYLKSHRLINGSEPLGEIVALKIIE